MVLVAACVVVLEVSVMVMACVVRAAVVMVVLAVVVVMVAESLSRSRWCRAPAWLAWCATGR